MAQIPQHIIDTIKDTANIVNIIGEEYLFARWELIM